jgi:prepilin-type N-terminal cleavage/methylation domain-containing protein
MGKLRGENGFTLIEVIVAVVIITTLVAVFVPLFLSSIEHIQWAGERTQELYTTRNLMEKAVASGTVGTDYSFTIQGPNFTGTAKGKLVRVGDGWLELVTFVVPMEF